MQWYQIVSLIVSALAIPTLFGFVWKDIYEKRKENSDKQKAKRKQEFQENVREVIRSENKPVIEKINCIDEKLDKVSNGTLSTLRNDIKDCFYACVEKGYRNDYDFKNIHDLYDTYKDLNGNSFIEDIMVRFDALPSKEEFTNKVKNNRAPKSAVKKDKKEDEKN